LTCGLVIKGGDMKYSWGKVICVIGALGIIPATSFAEKIEPCGSSAVKDGKTYKLNGETIPLMTGPGKDFSQVINQAATNFLGRIMYETLSNEYTVVVECSANNWSKIHVATPSDFSYKRGWIERSALRGKRLDSSGYELYEEADFSFNEKNRPYRKLIISGVNKVHRSDPRCKKINPVSAKVSFVKSTKSEPIFFVNCGEGKNETRVFFDKTGRVRKFSKPTPKAHVAKDEAVRICKEVAKSKSVHPSTVNFSIFKDLSIKEFENGRTRVQSTFTAKNSFNLELKYNISCLVDTGGLVESNIVEAR